MENETPREKLKALIERAGYTQSSLADALGYASTAGLNRYMREEEQEDRPIPVELVAALSPYLIWRGNPAIAPGEVLGLLGADIMDLIAVHFRAVTALARVGDDREQLVASGLMDARAQASSLPTGVAAVTIGSYTAMVGENAAGHALAREIAARWNAVREQEAI